MTDAYLLYLHRLEKEETPTEEEVREYKYSCDYEDLRGSLILKFFKSENIEKEFNEYLKDLFDFKSGFEGYFSSVFTEIHNEEYKNFLECNKEIIKKERISQNSRIQKITDVFSYQSFKKRIIQWEKHYLNYFGGTGRKYDLFACEVLFNHPYGIKNDKFESYFGDLIKKTFKIFREKIIDSCSSKEILLYQNIIEYFYFIIIEARPSWEFLVFPMFIISSAMDEITGEAGHKERIKEAIKDHIKKKLFSNEKTETYFPIFDKEIKEPNIYRNIANIENPSEFESDPALYQYYLKYKEDYKELADYLDDYWNKHPDYKEKCVREYFGKYQKECEEYLKSEHKEEMDITDEDLSKIFNHGSVFDGMRAYKQGKMLIF